MKTQTARKSTEKQNVVLSQEPLKHRLFFVEYFYLFLVSECEATTTFQKGGNSDNPFYCLPPRLDKQGQFHQWGFQGSFLGGQTIAVRLHCQEWPAKKAFRTL